MQTRYHFMRTLAAMAALLIGAAAQAVPNETATPTTSAASAGLTAADQGSLISRGKYLATAADCAACHTAKNGAEFAGGLAIRSPVGIIFASNITPSPTAGIGAYSEAQFAAALRRGVRADGANLYPAMPYTSYAVMTDSDVHALYTYFMHGVKPMALAAPKTALPFPMNIRASMMAWNLLFLDAKPYQLDPGQSVEWNRGKYLVNGAAHCSACHTPRGALMQEDSGQALSGGLVGPWYAPNITPDPVSGIGNWSKADLVAYLRDGRLHGKAQAAGSMGEAVEHSFQHLSDGDLNAMATYVHSIPAIHDAGDGHGASRFDQGKAGSMLATLRGDKWSGNGDANSGAKLFQGNCASCHSASAEGSKDGYFPSLFHNSVTGAVNANNLIATIVYGVNRSTGKGQAFMPGFGGGPHDLNALSDTQVAALASYVRLAYGAGASAPAVTPAQVAVVRQGGPASNLVTLARCGMAAGAVLVLLLLAFVWRRRRAALSHLN